MKFAPVIPTVYKKDNKIKATNKHVTHARTHTHTRRVRTAAAALDKRNGQRNANREKSHLQVDPAVKQRPGVFRTAERVEVQRAAADEAVRAAADAVVHFHGQLAPQVCCHLHRGPYMPIYM